MSERATPLHNQYFAKEGKQKPLPQHLRDALRLEASKEERKSLNKVAKVNHFDELDMDKIAQGRLQIESVVATRGTALQGVNAERIDEKVSLGVIDASRKIAESMIPIPEGTSKIEASRLRAQRNSVMRMMQIPTDQFDSMMTTWQRYEQIQFADERAAIEKDAYKEERTGHRDGPEARRAKKDMAELDKKHGKRLGYLSRLPDVTVNLGKNGDVDVDPVTAFNREWRLLSQNKKAFEKVMEQAKAAGLSEADIKREMAESFFANNLRDTLRTKYNKNVKGNRLLNLAPKAQEKRRQKIIDGLLTDRMQLFMDIALDDEANADFVTYKNKERKHKMYVEGYEHAYKTLTHSTVVSKGELQSYHDRYEQLRLSEMGRRLDESEIAEMRDLLKIVSMAEYGRAGLTDADGNANDKPQARERGLRQAFARMYARHTLANRASVGQTNTMKAALHTVEGVYDMADLSGEVAQKALIVAKKVGKRALTAIRNARNNKAVNGGAQPRPVVRSVNVGQQTNRR